MESKIRLGVIGGGTDSLVGVLHRVGSLMHDKYQIVGGVFSSDFNKNIDFAKSIGLKQNRIYKDFETLVTEEIKLPLNERIQAFSVLTPNFLHFPIVKKLLENGFHVICEKPMTTTYNEAKILEDTLKLTNTIFAVAYTYTGYPMVRQMRKMIENGSIGKVHKIDTQYYQGWINPIIHDEDRRNKTWRLDPKKSGVSCCIGDIGTHAFNMVEYVTGLKVKTVLADLNYLYADNIMDVDGTVLIRCSKDVKGIIRTSQVATGEENNFTIQVYGKNGGLKWDQENPNHLYFLEEGEPMKILKPGHLYNNKLAFESSKLPPGHPEGIFDSMGNIYNGVAKAIRNEPYDIGEFPTIIDGVRGMIFIEKVVESHQKGNVWINLESN